MSNDTDKTLLERAAKAAGIEVEWFTSRIWNDAIDGYEDATDGSGTFVACSVEWNPLTDDGDALRLAVRLGMSLHIYPGHHQGDQAAATLTRRSVEAREYAENNADDLQAATRRAIVRAAADIGGE